MGENGKCTCCKREIDEETDEYLRLERTTVDVETGRKETEERLFCPDCGDARFDTEASATRG